jgi:hypothetical protein
MTLGLAGRYTVFVVPHQPYSMEEFGYASECIIRTSRIRPLSENGWWTADLTTCVLKVVARCKLSLSIEPSTGSNRATFDHTSSVSSTAFQH